MEGTQFADLDTLTCGMTVLEVRRLDAAYAAAPKLHRTVRAYSQYMLVKLTVYHV